MNNPLVSVIMPVYNSQQYVKAAVNSIVNQTYENIEILCVNDCSTDDSLSVLNELASKDSRVKVIDSPVNVGAGEARNLAIKEAKGEFITFVDADDTIEPDLYQRVIDEINKNNPDQVVWGLVEEHFDDSDTLVKTVPIVSAYRFLDNETDIVKTVLELEENSLFGYQWNSFYRASVIKENHIRFEKALFYEDYFFNLEFAKCMKTFSVLDYAGYHYFKRVNSSITHRFTKDYFALSYRRIESMFRYCESMGYLEPEVYNILGNRLLRYTFSALSRNHNPLSEMSFSDMKKWVGENITREMYSLLLPKCEANNPAHKVLKILIKNRNSTLMVLIGKLVYLLK